jgi:hypothetical protein
MTNSTQGSQCATCGFIWITSKHEAWMLTFMLQNVVIYVTPSANAVALV